LNHTSAARLAETYTETRAFLEGDPDTAPCDTRGELRTAVPRTPKRHPNQLPTDQVDQLVIAYQAGGNARAVAARFGIHRSTVAAHLDRRGITKRGLKVLGEAQIEDAARLRIQGVSYERIANQFAVDKMTVWRALNGRK
jgi:DNA invertase Pin-like site-specific DNA recombinase